jgi:hypothetical protein
LLSLVLAGEALAAVTWQSPAVLPGSFAWNSGQGLARTASTSSGVLTAYLQAQYTTDYIGGVFASDSGPHMGVYHLRRSESSTSWSTPLRLNPADQHGSRGAIAAAGRWVYAAWASQESLESYDPGAGRALYLRYNTNHGRVAYWSGAVALSAPACPVPPGTCVEPRIDHPSLAAAGTRLYIAYTDGNTGRIILVSGTRPFEGFTAGPIGTTSALTDEGYSGEPAVAAIGSTVAVAWRSNASGTIKARVSTDYGAHWQTAVTLGTGSVSGPQGHGLGSRLAFAWTTATGVLLKVRQSGTWQSTRTVATFSSTGTFKAGYGATVALVGTSAIGVAWANCRRSDCEAVSGSANGVDLAWRESTTNGSAWKSTRTLANSTANASRRRNDFPSIAWSNSGRRNVLYTASSFDRGYERVFLRIGTGAP